MSTPSALIADRYRLVKMLGAGGMGVVWQAWDTRLRRTVALKMLRTQPELTDAERQVATDRALREARNTASLHHPHAVTIFDVVEHDGQPCIVMQLIDSTPLSELLRELGTFTPSETARIGAQVASALAAAHELKIVHRDVKPGNILITADGSAMISDFGISHALGDATITATGMIHGTPAFLAPEAARGLPTSFASDVFSLGSTLYALVEGSPPFGTDRNSIALLHKVARGGYAAPERAGPLTPLLRKMLATQPKRRPTMVTVADALGSMHGPGADRDVPASFIALGFDAVTVGLEAETAPTVPAPVGPGSPPDSVDPPGPTPPDERSTARTIPFDQPTRFEAPTAETERLGKPVAAAPASVEARSEVAVPEPARAPARERRRPARIAAAALLALLVVVVAAAILYSLLRPSPTHEADPRPEESSVTNPGPSSGPEQVAPAQSPSPTASAPAEEVPEPPAVVTPEQRVVEAISAYYAMMPENRDGAWPLMTADYQANHAGGREGYEAFWSEIVDVSITDVTASGPDRGEATLTYSFRDGRVAQEVTVYRLREEDGILKIAATEVLSSRDL
ncbi:protein kinase [Microbacterium sp. LWH7-1.2]|uniref:serine/threonine-protein kinase n=1 Tax=Microbacterium sp. LWH7-1.2 TaxID=3135257 RepID=UPI0031393F22